MKLDDLVTDSKTGRYSHHKIGVLIAGLIFSAKMSTLPDDWTLWAVYMGTVGGYAVLLRMIAGKANA